MKPAPMPWILCGPGLSSCPASFWLITGLAAGSTATERSGLAPRLLEVAGDPGDGPPRADAGDEHIGGRRRCRPRSPSPWSSRGSRIRRVLELLGRKYFSGSSAARAPRPRGHGSLHAFRPGGQHQVGPEELRAPAGARGSWSPAWSGSACSRGPRIRRPGRCPCCRWWARRSRVRGCNQPPLLGVPDHGGADAALDRVGGVATLDFGQDGCLVLAGMRLRRTSGVRPMDSELSS